MRAENGLIPLAGEEEGSNPSAHQLLSSLPPSPNSAFPPPAVTPDLAASAPSTSPYQPFYTPSAPFQPVDGTPQLRSSLAPQPHLASIHEAPETALSASLASIGLSSPLQTSTSAPQPLNHIVTESPGPLNLSRTVAQNGGTEEAKLQPLVARLFGGAPPAANGAKKLDASNPWNLVKQSMNGMRGGGDAVNVEFQGHPDIQALGNDAHPQYHSAARKIQNKWYKSKHNVEILQTRLNRQNLIDRLALEHRVIVGSFRMFTQLATFAFIVFGLLWVGDTEKRRGIFLTLNDAFDLDEVSSVSSREELVDLMQTISLRSKTFLPLSSQYFLAEQDSVEILGPTYSFPHAMVFPRLELASTSFSFTAWVKYTVDKGLTRNLITKRTKVESQDVYCFSFSIQNNGPFYGPLLSYGGHDFFNVGSEFQQISYNGLWTVRAEQNPAFGASQDHMVFLAFVLNNTHVQFYHEGVLLGGMTQALPRPVTDCSSTEGLLLGDEGLEMAHVTFHTKQLTEEDIRQIREHGAVLEDISSGAAPTPAVLRNYVPTAPSSSTVVATDTDVERAVSDAEGALVDQGTTAVSNFMPSNVPWEEQYTTPDGKRSNCNTLAADLRTPDRRFFQKFIDDAARVEPGQDRVIHSLPSNPSEDVVVSVWFRFDAYCGESFDCWQNVFAVNSARNPTTGVMHRVALYVNLRSSVDVLDTACYIGSESWGDIVIYEDVDMVTYRLKPSVWRHLALSNAENGQNRVQLYLDGRPYGSVAGSMSFDYGGGELKFNENFEKTTLDFFDLRLWTPFKADVLVPWTEVTGFITCQLGHCGCGYELAPYGEVKFEATQGGATSGGTMCFWQLTPPGAQTIEVRVMSDNEALPAFACHLPKGSTDAANVECALNWAISYNTETNQYVGSIASPDLTQYDIVIATTDGTQAIHFEWETTAWAVAEERIGCVQDEWGSEQLSESEFVSMSARPEDLVLPAAMLSTLDTCLSTENQDDYWVLGNEDEPPEAKKDSNNRECDWYQEHSAKYPVLCEKGWGGINCPVACGATSVAITKCWPGRGADAVHKVAYAFNRIVRIEPINSTLVQVVCVGSGDTSEEELCSSGQTKVLIDNLVGVKSTTGCGFDDEQFGAEPPCQLTDGLQWYCHESAEGHMCGTLAERRGVSERMATETKELVLETPKRLVEMGSRSCNPRLDDICQLSDPERETEEGICANLPGLQDPVCAKNWSDTSVDTQPDCDPDLHNEGTACHWYQVPRCTKVPLPNGEQKFACAVPNVGVPEAIPRGFEMCGVHAPCLRTDDYVYMEDFLCREGIDAEGAICRFDTNPIYTCENISVGFQCVVRPRVYLIRFEGQDFVAPPGGSCDPAKDTEGSTCTSSWVVNFEQRCRNISGDLQCTISAPDTDSFFDSLVGYDAQGIMETIAPTEEVIWSYPFMGSCDPETQSQGSPCFFSVADVAQIEAEGATWSLPHACRQHPVGFKCMSTREPIPNHFQGLTYYDPEECVISTGTTCTTAGGLTGVCEVRDDQWSCVAEQPSDGEGVWIMSELRTEVSSQCRHVDPECTFELQPLQDLWQEIVTSNSGFTLSFWIKTLGETSLERDGTFRPEILFRSSMKDGEIGLSYGVWGGYESTLPCFQHMVSAYVDQVAGLSTTDWTFIALSAKDPGIIDGFWELKSFVNLKYESSAVSIGGDPNRQCTELPQRLFEAISVSKPLIMSPVSLEAKYMTVGEVHNLYYTSAAWGTAMDINLRPGPRRTDLERNNSTIDIEKQDYPSRTTLLASPIVFQTRFTRTSSCEFQFSNRYVNEQLFTKAAIGKCSGNRVCRVGEKQSVLPEDVVSCEGEPQLVDNYFGIAPKDFQGSTGFDIFLFSLVDFDYLFRDGILRSTTDFVDSATQTVKIVLVFFTPQYGISTILTITADFASPRGSTTAEWSHFGIVEGRRLFWFSIASYLVLVFNCIMLLDLIISFIGYLDMRNVKGRIREWLQTWCNRRAKNRSVAHSIQAIRQINKESNNNDDDEVEIKLSALVFKCVDIATILIVPIVMMVRLEMKVKSVDQADVMLGKFSEIQWGERDTNPETEFFTNVDKIMGEIGREDFLDTLSMIALLLLILRTIQLTSLHPRLALLTGTIVAAMDDFWHAAILIILLLLSFGTLSLWRFGSEREDFGTLANSLMTEFGMAFGEFPEDWMTSGSWDLPIFTVIFFLIVFVLCLNFLLAIVVESYMGVRRENEVLEVEQEVLSDLTSSVRSVFLRVIHGWPRKPKLVMALKNIPAKYNLSFKELVNTGLFRNSSAVVTFIQHYAVYDFMAPVHITIWGGPPQGLADEIERRLCKMLDLDPMKIYLKKIATKQAIAEDPQLIPEMYRDKSRTAQVVSEGTKVEPSGVKKALLIAIHYQGTRYELSGCVSDSLKMQAMLEEEAGFKKDDIVLLTDAKKLQKEKGHKPTRENILKYCKWLVQGAKLGDVLVFQFSGHGHQVVDNTGVEADGMDETILTSDLQYIIDDELWRELVEPLPSGVALTAVMDCCHSGTGLDLPYSWEYGRWVEDKHPSHSQGDVRLFSACSDNQKIVDENRSNLTLTKAFARLYLKTRESNPSYKGFLALLKQELKSAGRKEEPQLSASQDLDTSAPFSITDGITANRNRLVGHLWRPLKHHDSNSLAPSRPSSGLTKSISFDEALEPQQVAQFMNNEPLTLSASSSGLDSIPPTSLTQSRSPLETLNTLARFPGVEAMQRQTAPLGSPLRHSPEPKRQEDVTAKQALGEIRQVAQAVSQLQEMMAKLMTVHETKVEGEAQAGMKQDKQSRQQGPGLRVGEQSEMVLLPGQEEPSEIFLA